MGRTIVQAASLTLAVIALTQAVSYATWGDMEGGYAMSIVVTGVLIPAATCFPISMILLLQRRRLAGTLSRLQHAHLRLKELSSRDPMTGLLHRQAFFERLPARSHLAGAFLMIDVDHFKSINDTSGHAAGDEALHLIAAALAEGAGASDILARFGGEEFCLFMPAAGPMEAARRAEHIRRRIGKLDFAPGGRRRRLTVSIGVADAVSFASAEAAIGAADDALYEAKRAGRNRVVVCPPPQAPLDAASPCGASGRNVA